MPPILYAEGTPQEGMVAIQTDSVSSTLETKQVVVRIVNPMDNHIEGLMQRSEAITGIVV